jgi:hypothetical protein
LQIYITASWSRQYWRSRKRGDFAVAGKKWREE